MLLRADSLQEEADSGGEGCGSDQSGQLPLGQWVGPAGPLGHMGLSERTGVPWRAEGRKAARAGGDQTVRLRAGARAGVPAVRSPYMPSCSCAPSPVCFWTGAFVSVLGGRFGFPVTSTTLKLSGLLEGLVGVPSTGSGTGSAWGAV